MFVISQLCSLSIRRDFYFLRFPLKAISRSSHTRFCVFLLEISIQLFFFPFLFPRFCCCSACPYIVSAVTGCCNQSFITFFNVVFESLHPHNLQCWQVLFLLLFLTHIVCLCQLSDPFVLVPSLSILRIVLSILQGELLRCLSLWWDSCYRVWFQEVFSFVWSSFFLFFLRFLIFDSVHFQYSQILAIFFFSFWFFPNLAVLFLLSFVFFHFSLWAWHIFLCQISFLYPGCIFLLLLSVSSSFSFFAIICTCTLIFFWWVCKFVAGEFVNL